MMPGDGHGTGKHEGRKMKPETRAKLRALSQKRVRTRTGGRLNYQLEDHVEMVRNSAKSDIPDFKLASALGVPLDYI